MRRIPSTNRAEIYHNCAREESTQTLGRFPRFFNGSNRFEGTLPARRIVQLL
jgi:hypothetical protein